MRLSTLFLASTATFSCSSHAATTKTKTPAATTNQPITRQKLTPQDCKQIHLFLARGAGDPYPGTQGPLVPAVCDALPSCDHEDILYVGTFDRVCNSVQVGVANATSQIAAYAARCPESKLVLCGHSEGAAAVGNTLGGGSVAFPGCSMGGTKGLDPSSGGGVGDLSTSFSSFTFSPFFIYRFYSSFLFFVFILLLFVLGGEGVVSWLIRSRDTS